MIKIAFDYQAFFMQEYGGISRYYSQLADHLSALEGVDARIIAPLHVNAHVERLRPGILWGKRARGRARSKKLHRGLNTILSRLQIRRYRPDVMHETYWSAKSLAPQRGALVVTVHDMIHERFPELFPQKDRTSLLKREAVRRANHVICISESTRSDLIEYFGVPTGKISVVPHGFGQFAPSEASETAHVPQMTRPYFLYVGQRSSYKNFNAFIRAFSVSPVLKRNFGVVCFGGGRFSSSETALFAQNGLDTGQIVHVSGDDDVLVRCYRGAFAFVYPSLYEGFGIPPLEAMSLDCPVICSGTSSIPEVVGDAAELFDPASDESIRDAMERVATSSARRDELIRLGRQRYRMFTWPRCAAQTLAIYQRLV